MSNNYIEYETNGSRKKAVSVKEYLDKMRQHLKDIKNYLEKSESGKFN